jgi:hypothetical protein
VLLPAGSSSAGTRRQIDLSLGLDRQPALTNRGI